MLELDAFGVPSQAHPVIQGLDGQVNVFGNFYFEHGQTAGGFNRDQINKVAISCGERQDLRMYGPGLQRRIDELNISPYRDFKCGFGGIITYQSGQIHTG